MHPLRHECACEFQRIANISTVIHQPRQLARRTRIQRVHGTELEDKIWKLSLKGLKQIEIANQLGISPTRVSRYISRRMSRIEESAP